MATRPKTGQTCAKCGKPAPPRTHLFNTLCKPCREAKVAAPVPAPVRVPVKVTSSSRTPDQQAERDAVDKGFARARAAARPERRGRQQVLSFVVDDEIAELKRQLERSERERKALMYLVEGVAERVMTPAQVKAALKARAWDTSTTEDAA